MTAAYHPGQEHGGNSSITAAPTNTVSAPTIAVDEKFDMLRLRLGAL